MLAMLAMLAARFLVLGVTVALLPPLTTPMRLTSSLPCAPTHKAPSISSLGRIRSYYALQKQEWYAKINQTGPLASDF